MIGATLRGTLEQTLGSIRSVSHVGGGSISNAFRLELSDGPVFLKVRGSSPAGFFESERAGLTELAATGAPFVIPRVIGHGDAAGEAYLLMEWLEETPADGFQRQLGRGLAELHRQPRNSWGWTSDGFIGSLRQTNALANRWSEFWFLRRLEPQLRLLQLPVGTSREWSELERLLPELLAAAVDDGPSLLHGDLWSGNVMSTSRGPALIDPACYQGHREVDLAMAELFGGFGADFFSSYAEVRPLQPGYEARKGVYQLYYLLVHVNLFGASYVARTRHTLHRILTQA